MVTFVFIPSLFRLAQGYIKALLFAITSLTLLIYHSFLEPRPFLYVVRDVRSNYASLMVVYIVANGTSSPTFIVFETLSNLARKRRDRIAGLSKRRRISVLCST